MQNEKDLFECRRNSIKKVLYKALETDYYRKKLKNINIDGITYDEFKKIPTLNKQTLNFNMLGMLTSKYKYFDSEFYRNLPYNQKRKYLEKNGLELKVTSGSTGSPIEVIKSKEDINRDYITLNWYRRKLTTYDFKGRFIWIWPVNPLIRSYFYPDAETNVFWDVNNYGTQYMLYSYSEENLKILYEYIVENKVEWLTSSPNALVNFIDYMEKNSIQIDTIKYIECHSEYLYDWQKEKIIQAFNCEVVSIYSSNEMQFIGGTCKCGHMHLFDSSCFMELLDNRHGGKDVYITSLNYLDIPIIRYKLGDCGEWENEQQCRLLNNKKIFLLKKYRENDYIVGLNGKKYEPFIITDSIVFLMNSFNLSIDLYRVKQVDINRFEYYFDESVHVFDLDECKKVLENYLESVLNYTIVVDIYKTPIKEFTYDGSKFRYFEVDSELLSRLTQ